jgi:hypothetical protein
MNEPNIYEAVTAYATAATAIPAIIGAYFAWLQARQYVVVETSQIIRGRVHGPAQLELTVTLRNRRRAAIQTWALEILGLPATAVEAEGGVHKGMPPWTNSTAPFPDKVIAPGEAADFTFIVQPDWPAALVLADSHELKWSVVLSYNDRTHSRRRWWKRVRTSFERDKLERWARDALGTEAAAG